MCKNENLVSKMRCVKHNQIPHRQRKPRSAFSYPGAAIPSSEATTNRNHQHHQPHRKEQEATQFSPSLTGNPPNSSTQLTSASAMASESSLWREKGVVELILPI